MINEIIEPKVRFNEFKKGWLKIAVKNLCTFKDSDRIPLSSEERSKRQGKYPYYGASKIIDYVDDYLFDGEYVLLGEDGANILNRSSPLAFVISGKNWVNNHAHIMKASGSNKFLAESLERIRYEKYNTGTAQPKLNSDVCKKIVLNYPQELEEQHKIAAFLSSVDKKISLLKEKNELLLQYKKGVMQKLFSQEIRFKDENGNDFSNWENKVVGDFMVESKVKGSSGLTAKKITVKLWGKGVFEKNENILGSENTQYYTRKAGQFLYSKLDFLNCAFGIVPDFLDDFETTVDLPCFDIADGINKYLILEFIKQKCFYKKYGDMADGSRKAKRIHAKDFLSFPMNLPCEQEQNRIAGFLQALDKKRDLVSQQIEQTQTFKKGVLQQMFA